MRTCVLWNEDWRFIREDVDLEAAQSQPGVPVALPHTWNAVDGQDGGNDYYRGVCWYTKRFPRPEVPKGGSAWLEFRGAAMTAGIWLNGRRLGLHEGGYSTFRVELTEALEDDNLLAVSVDNGPNRRVYPQKADFTFYGGIYRDVYLLTVPAVHFALDYYGGPAIKATPRLSGDLRSAEVVAEAWVTGPAESVIFRLDGQEREAAVVDGASTAVFTIPNVRLWDGVESPCLYTVTASLPGGDSVSARFGCRSFSVDPEKGFILNGRPYRLCGAARHQDRKGMGNAITRREQEEDIALLLEMGANTVRLAHYQHDQYFYDLCDEKGLIVWAEIPYITEHMPEARENTISQMTELIVQNYNHPSIVCWGLSNEITAAGGVTEDLVENHRELNALCHRLDSTRPTTMAHVFVLDPTDPFVMLPDIRSYNLYYGWYVGDWQQNDQRFDEFHAAHPDAVIGLSEYGADGRDEGGKPGQNQKGLVTFDRRTRKDAFYIYKAYLSKTPFVHICGSRYVDRTESETEIKVYSNQPEVTLYVDGRTVETRRGDKVFRFKVPITNKHSVMAKAGDSTSVILIQKVDAPNPGYRKPGGDVVNWFDREDEVEGYFSVLDPMGQVKAHPQAGSVLMELLEPLQAKAAAAYGDVAKSVQIPENVQRMMDKMSIQDTLKQMGSLVTPEFIRELNAELNRIKK